MFKNRHWWRNKNAVKTIICSRTVDNLSEPRRSVAGVKGSAQCRFSIKTTLLRILGWFFNFKKSAGNYMQECSNCKEYMIRMKDGGWYCENCRTIITK